MEPISKTEFKAHALEVLRESSMLIKKGRLNLYMDAASWIDEVSQIDGVRFVPVDNEIGIQSANLPGEFHQDPAGRMIVVTARRVPVPLVTADKKIINYNFVKTIW